MQNYAVANERGESSPVTVSGGRVHPEERSVKLHAHGILRDLDVDQDGFINEGELMKHVVTAAAEHKQHELLKRVIFGMGIIIMFFTFVSMALTYAVIESTKETRMNDNDVMISVGTGDPAQCASADFVVINGALVPRDSQNDGDSVRRRMQTTGNYLEADSISALATRSVMQKRQLASTMPDAYFKELSWLEIQTDFGVSLSLKINAISRVMHSKAKCGTFLKLVTSAGILILDDVDIFYDDDVAGMMEEAGFVRFTKQSTTDVAPFGVSSKIPHTRRLDNIIYLNDPYVKHMRMVHDAPIRRLTSEGALEIIGFFNFIDNLPWTCSSVEKPDMPDVYSAEISILKKCKIIPDVGDNCLYTSRRFQTDMYGVTLVDGERYMPGTQWIYRTAETTAVVVSFPYHPNVSDVVLHFPSSGLTRSYQVQSDGQVTHCASATMETPIMRLPDDYIFAYIGLVENTNLRHFRISTKITEVGLDDNATVTTRYKSIDYYDDATTKYPELIVQEDGSLVEVKNMRTGDNALRFRDSGYAVTTRDFEFCVIAAEAAGSADGVQDLKNSTLTDPDNPENVARFAAIQSWDWTKPYPPAVAGVRSFSPEDLQYYVDLLVPTIPDPNDVNDTIYQPNTDWGFWALRTMNASREFREAKAMSRPNSTIEIMTSNFDPSSDTSLDADARHSVSIQDAADNDDPVWNRIWADEFKQGGRARAFAGGALYFRLDTRDSTIAVNVDVFSFAFQFYFGWKNGLQLYFTSGGCFKKVICGDGIIRGQGNNRANERSFGGTVKVYVDLFNAFGPVRNLIPEFIRNLGTREVFKVKYDYIPEYDGKIDGNRARYMSVLGTSVNAYTNAILQIKVKGQFRTYQEKYQGEWRPWIGDLRFFTILEVRDYDFPFGFSWDTKATWKVLDEDWRWR